VVAQLGADELEEDGQPAAVAEGLLALTEQVPDLDQLTLELARGAAHVRILRDQIALVEDQRLVGPDPAPQRRAARRDFLLDQTLERIPVGGRELCLADRVPDRARTMNGVALRSLADQLLEVIAAAKVDSAFEAVVDGLGDRGVAV
jgi:hypothetical protein